MHVRVHVETTKSHNYNLHILKGISHKLNLAYIFAPMVLYTMAQITMLVGKEQPDNRSTQDRAAWKNNL